MPRMAVDTYTSSCSSTCGSGWGRGRGFAPVHFAPEEVLHSGHAGQGLDQHHVAGVVLKLLLMVGSGQAQLEGLCQGG